jgi:hypothetical protein
MIIDSKHHSLLEDEDRVPQRLEDFRADPQVAFEIRSPTRQGEYRSPFRDRQVSQSSVGTDSCA